MSSEVRSRKPALSSGLWFLLGVSGGYLVLWLWQPHFVRASMERFVHMALDLLPVLALVFLFLWLFNLLGSLQERTVRLTDRNAGWRGWLLAVGLGVLSHGPVYPWYPMLRQLMRQGARPALVATFLYARSIKLPWLPVMAHYFGLEYTAILTGWMLLLSPLHGWLVERMAGVAFGPATPSDPR